MASPPTARSQTGRRLQMSVVRQTVWLGLRAFAWAALLGPTRPATADPIQAPKFFASNPMGLAKQGFSVAVSIDGTTAIVGGPFDDQGAGAAWVFTRGNGGGSYH